MQLVGVDDGADGLDHPVGDVEREHVDDPVLGVVGDGAGLAVDPGRLHPDAHPGCLPGQAGHEPGHPEPAGERPGRGPGLAAAVAHDDHVGRKHLEQRIHVATLGGGEEAPGHLVTLGAGGVEARLALVHVMPGAGEDLAAVRFGLAGDLGDLPVVVGEDLVQQEHGPLGRRQALQQDQEGHGQGIGHLRTLRRIWFGARDQGLGQPGPHVGLAPHPGRLQVGDGQPGGGRGQIGLGRADAAPVAQDPGQPQERLLDDVLGVADAAGHPVGDREHQRPELQVIAGLR
jgi:hypothetical protein